MTTKPYWDRGIKIRKKLLKEKRYDLILKELISLEKIFLLTLYNCKIRTLLKFSKFMEFTNAHCYRTMKMLVESDMVKKIKDGRKNSYELSSEGRKVVEKYFQNIKR